MIYLFVEFWCVVLNITRIERHNYVTTHTHFLLLHVPHLVHNICQACTGRLKYFCARCHSFSPLLGTTHISFSSSNNQLWIPNFCNEFFVYLLFEYFYQVIVLNYYHNTPKNANINLYIKKKENTLQHLKWGNWYSEFLKLVVWWAEQVISTFFSNKFHMTKLMFITFIFE